MAEKKYIGKPGKQDDPCWKGYEMVGMKKKGGRKVPNCVPEATDIIAKAKTRLAEKRGSDYTLYHKSYTDAINHALSHHQKSGLHVSDDDRFQHVGVGSKKPSEGNTTSVSMPATHTSGKKHMVHVQVFNKGGTHPYELNTYSSGMGRHVKEAADNYPREGFPKEGDYGYHPNPGLKPQESDKDEDMDVAYKKATEKEGRKPLNAKVLEIDEALTRVTSGNKGYGYHGNVEARDDAEKDKRYSAMHRYAKKLVGDAGHLQDAKKPNVMVKHFLDSAHGRHIADNPTDKNITSRFAHFKKSYDSAMHEEVEAIDELSKDAMLNYLHANKHKNTKGGNPRRDLVKSMRGTDLAVRKYTAKPGSKYVRVPATEEVELDEAYGMWKVDFPKQHAGKPVAAGSVHVKAQNTAHAHKVAAKRVGVDHTVFKSKVTKSSVLPEEVELDESVDKNHPIVKEYTALKKHDIKTLRGMIAKSGGVVDTSGFKSKDHAASHLIRSKHGNKKVDAAFGFKEDVDSYADALIKRNKGNLNKGHVVNAARIAGMDDKKLMSAVNKKVGHIKEELGKSNEWGRPELRKKYAAMTPGQESMTADKIPTFDPRYDDVTTQYCGGIKEGYLAEISARGAEARAKFQAKVRQTLADPKNIARAKKTLAKKKETEKAKEPPHLVMQLRKAVSIGSKVHFQDGSHHTIAPNHADVFMSKYNSAKSSIEKEALQKRAHKSHSEFMKTIAEGVHENCGTPDCCQMCDTAEMGTHHVDSYEAHKGSGDQISPVISHDDEDIRFQDFDEAAFEKELEADVLALSWDDLVDLYDEDEIEYDESPEMEEEGEGLEEGITPAGRLKKKFNAMRTKSRRNMARNIAIKRVSTPEKLKSRSVRAARRMVYKRLLRNRDISTVSSAEKTRLEAQIKRMAPMVARLSVRVMPAVRKLEQSRIKNSRTRKKK